MIMKFFVTHGQGLDPFVKRELEGKFGTLIKDLNISLGESKAGKIFFNVPPSARAAMTLAEADPGDDVSALSDMGFSEWRRTCSLLISSLHTVERLFYFLFENTDSECLNGWRRKREVLTGIYDLTTTQMSSSIRTLNWIFQYLSADADTSKDEIVDVDGEPHTKRLKSNKTFRINVKISGRYKKTVGIKEVASCVGSAAVKILAHDGWSIDLKKPTLEISLYLTDEGVLSGVSLTRQPISERFYLKKIPLRSTVAFAMASLTMEDETTEDNQLVVIDPMCGSATILIELTKKFSQTLFTVGVDNSADQIAEAVANINESGVGSKVIVFMADSKKILPFRQSFVFDAVVCDLPFGIQHGTQESVRKELPMVLEYMSAVVKPKGNIVLLISSGLSSFLEDLCGDKRLNWCLRDKYNVKLGELSACIFHFKR